MLSGVVKNSDKTYKHNGNISWNFTRYLIDKEGNIVERFEPTDMKNLKEKISELL
jgi:glutathione peroxidase